MTATARCAASAAGGPCPRPSITATMVRSPLVTTSEASPVISAPDDGREATDQLSGPSTGTAHPLAHRDDRPDSDRRVDLELVHQPARAGQAEPHAARRGEPVLHRPFDVGDARAVVAG